MRCRGYVKKRLLSPYRLYTSSTSDPQISSRRRHLATLLQCGGDYVAGPDGLMIGHRTTCNDVDLFFITARADMTLLATSMAAWSPTTKKDTVTTTFGSFRSHPLRGLWYSMPMSLSPLKQLIPLNRLSTRPKTFTTPLVVTLSTMAR